MAISADQCVSILGQALSNRPAETYSDDALNWFADVAAAVTAYNPITAVRINSLLSSVSQVDSGSNDLAMRRRFNACAEFMVEARAIYTRLRLETNSFTSAQVAQGQVHNYFEEVRRLIGAATSEILFIDPYLDAEFVTRYLPQVPSGVSVKLLTSEAKAAVMSGSLAAYRGQYGGAIELRVLPDRSLHDRHLVVDGRDVWQSGASFKDGARNAPTSITQIVDIAPDMIRAHESRWQSARAVA